MKVSSVLLAFVAAARTYAQEVVTVTYCKLGDLDLPESICKYYLDQGVLQYVSGGQPSLATPVPALIDPTPVVESQPPLQSPVDQAPVLNQPSIEPAVAPDTPLPAANDNASPDTDTNPATNPIAANNKAVGASSAISNVNNRFVDGTVSCDQVPIQFGADPGMSYYLGGSGWLNSQIGNLKNDAIANLRNAIGCNPANMGGDQVMYCNYNCPEGMLPTQRPSQQGINGESVGGLECRTGFLYRTNLASAVLCVAPSNKVNVEMVNHMSQEIVICRTNYPGDEAMTIPIPVPPGQTVSLPVIDSDTYYRASGNRATTAQYYINEPGVSIAEACVWGLPGSRKGNFVTMNMGAGIQGDQPAYVSLFTNYPTENLGTYPGHIQLVGEGIAPSSGCSYDGFAGILNFNGADVSTKSQSSSIGCTIAVNQGGTLRYVFT